MHTNTDKRICRCNECIKRRSDSSKRAIQTRNLEALNKKITKQKQKELVEDYSSEESEY